MSNHHSLRKFRTQLFEKSGQIFLDIPRRLDPQEATKKVGADPHRRISQRTQHAADADAQHAATRNPSSPAGVSGLPGFPLMRDDQPDIDIELLAIIIAFTLLSIAGFLRLM